MWYTAYTAGGALASLPIGNGVPWWLLPRPHCTRLNYTLNGVGEGTFGVYRREATFGPLPM